MFMTFLIKKKYNLGAFKMKWETSDLKKRLRGREILGAFFVKTPHPIIFELLGLSGLDFVVLDKEHAPFDNSTVDTCMIAARAGGIPVITRMSSNSHSEMQTVLDCGGTGIFVPHIRSVEDAEHIVLGTKYGVPFGRGFAGSTRAARYTRKSLPEHMADTAEQTCVIATIEDVEAVECVEDIAKVEGLDALFIGPMDLTVAYGQTSPDSEVVQKAIQRICDAARAANIGVGIYLGDASKFDAYKKMGMTFFLMGSEHSSILNEGKRLMTALKG